MLSDFKKIISSAKESGHLVAVTHEGIFHTDDISCVAILRILCKKKGIKLTLIRTWDLADIPKDNNVIVFDFGGGLLDHHNKEDKQVAVDGRVLSSIGKLWRFGKEEFMSCFELNEMMWSRIDKELWKPIDITDNKSRMNPLTYCFNAIRASNPKETCLEACISFLEGIYSSVIKAARLLQVDTESIAGLPTLMINNKIFRFSDKWRSGFDPNPNVVGIIWKAEDGTYGIKMFGNNCLSVKGVKNNTDPNIIYITDSGRNGQVKNLEDLQKIV